MCTRQYWRVAGKLVDMLAIPINNPAKAPILAIDALAASFCSVDKPTAAAFP